MCEKPSQFYTEVSRLVVDFFTALQDTRFVYHISLTGLILNLVGFFFVVAAVFLRLIRHPQRVHRPSPKER